MYRGAGEIYHVLRTFRRRHTFVPASDRWTKYKLPRQVISDRDYGLSLSYSMEYMESLVICIRKSGLLSNRVIVALRDRDMGLSSIVRLFFPAVRYHPECRFCFALYCRFPRRL